MKYAILLVAILLAGCDQATFSHFESDAIHKACTENGGVVVAHMDNIGVTRIECKAIPKWSPKD